MVEGSLFTSWKIVFRGRELEADNARLRAENDSLRAENESLRSKAAEADRLRSDLGLVRGLKPPPLARVHSRVSAFAPSGLDRRLQGNT